MRNPAALAVILALGLAGCGSKGDPAPAPSESPPMAPAAAIGESAPAPTAPATAPPPEIKLSGTAQAPSKLRALGTEPFWSVQIDGAKLLYTTPEDQKGKTIVAKREDSSISSTWVGKLDGKPFELWIVPEKCSDGMSDIEYPFSARLEMGGSTVHRGCAKAGS